MYWLIILCLRAALCELAVTPVVESCVAFVARRELFIYYPVAHWVWGGGFLDTMGVLDFAGGIVLHTTAGTSALITALMLGT